MTRVKICGITGAEDLDLVISAGVDAVGFISGVSVDTAREIDADEAAELVASTPPFVTTVLVTMPESLEAAAGLIDAVQPDVLQVHGGLASEDLNHLAENAHPSIVKAVTPDDAERYDPIVDALLVDSLDESGAGGTGEAHDWNRTRNLVTTLDSPVILAGGLTPTNVAEAINRVQPFAVDVASGVEAEPGRKDPEAVRAFLEGAGVQP